jgi:hypothetical protein
MIIHRIGILESWNIGMLGLKQTTKILSFCFPLFHHFIIPMAECLTLQVKI